MAKSPESRLQQKIKKALENAFPGSFWFKSHGGPYQQKGIPDLIGVVQGKFIGVEVKVPGREHNLTDIQKHTIELINKAGGIAFMSTSVEHSVETIQKRLNL